MIKLRVLQRNYLSLRKVYPRRTRRKVYFLAACLIFLDMMEHIDDCDMEARYGGLIGIGNSRLDKYLSRYKIFRLHAVLHDAAGHVKRVYNTGPGYSYIIPFPFNWCFVGHVFGLLFCLYLKFFDDMFKELNV